MLQALPGKRKPSLVLRTDVANVYGRELPKALFSRMIDSPVEQALRLDATCVVVNLFRIPGQPEVTDQCIQNILAIKPQCDRYSMPLMIEPLVFQSNEKAGGYMVDGDVRKSSRSCARPSSSAPTSSRPDPTDDVSVYHKVVEISDASPSSCAAAARRPMRKSSSAPKRSSSRARPASSMAATSFNTKIPPA